MLTISGALFAMTVGPPLMLMLFVPNLAMTPKVSHHVSITLPSLTAVSEGSVMDT